MELGTGHIDTAGAYGFGVVEGIRCEALHPYPDHRLLTTKMGQVHRGPAAWGPVGHQPRPARLQPQPPTQPLTGTTSQLDGKRTLPLRRSEAGAAVPLTDLGGIRAARATEAATLFVPHVIRSSGCAPFAVSIAR